ncbi:replication protein [Planococcus antarcticus DSM 14505]|uniref:Replication protein n=1 Tax=Planococcus antarcticus DSM 14505 TaxID=1185653 RepID=A0AA87III7_9BACL|nr:winged helix-turn-helix transcriptional regulator [Planococcus antarcticus]EIM05334.1 replication protein [Planococcus antarcticus DSM 14505]
MGIIKLVEEEGKTQIKHWQNAYLSPTKRRGSVGVVQWKESKDGRTSESRQWITLKNAGDLSRMSSGIQKRLTNAFLTLNAFQEVNGQTNRRTANLAQIRNIGVDIDCYNVGMTPEQAEGAIQDMIIQCEIPNPNLVIWSGNGLQLIYSIEGGAAPSLAWLTKHITVQLVAKASALGADAACTDLTRVFRLPGSYNQKPGKETKLVRVELWRTLEYDLSELYAYCEPLEHRKKRISKPHLYPLPKRSDMGYKTQTLNLTRINDFYKLIDLREGNIENRNVLLYDFSYCFGLQTDIEDAVIQQANRMNNSLDDPISKFEVERVAKNAFNDSRSYWKTYSDNGYRALPYRTNDGIIKPKKNETLIEHHGITTAEMKEMQTIIDGNEKYARLVAKRRAAGMKTLKEHNDTQKADKAQRAYLLAKLKAENPGATQRQLAGMMGVSIGTVNNLLKELK